jgi:hypothetical protein
VSAALELSPAGRHPYYCAVAGAHVEALIELGRTEQAIELGRGYLEVCRAEQLAAERWVEQALARALARGGRHAEAVEVIEQAIGSAERLGIGGLALGALYETRARIAIASGDSAAYEHHAQLCAREYKKGKNAALAAKFARLVEEARQREIEQQAAVMEAEELLLPPESETAYETIQSRLLECVDSGDRARCALTMLLQSVDSYAGHLYGVGEGGRLAPLASLPDTEPDPRLAAWLEGVLQAELEEAVDATDDGDDDEAAPGVSGRYTDGAGRSFEPILLSAHGEQGERIAAVFVLQVQPGPRALPSRPLMAEIAAQLLDHGDVAGVPV